MTSSMPFKWSEFNDCGDFHTGFRWRLRYFNVVAFCPWPYLIMIGKIQPSAMPCLRAQIREFPRYRQLLIHETGIASLVIRLDVHRVVRVQRRYVVKGTGLLFWFLQKLLIGHCHNISSVFLIAIYKGFELNRKCSSECLRIFSAVGGIPKASITSPYLFLSMIFQNMRTGHPH